MFTRSEHSHLLHTCEMNNWYHSSILHIATPVISLSFSTTVALINMLQKTAILFIVTNVMLLFAEKYPYDVVNNYSEFLNFGDKKLSKLNRSNLENAVIKSKVEVLGEVFKHEIDALKSSVALDLVFLVDASSSIGESNFRSELKFVKKFISDLTVDYNHTRVAIITFGSAESVVCIVSLSYSVNYYYTFFKGKTRR